MTSKQRAYLKKLASELDIVAQIGKAGVTPEAVNSIAEVLEARELIKIKVLKNCELLPIEVAVMVANRTQSECVQVMGHKITLYKPASQAKQRKIKLPK